MADADKLSLSITTDADKASSSIQRLTKNLGVLWGVMKSLESGKGLKDLNTNLENASVSVDKALKNANAEFKSTAKDASTAAKAIKEVQKVTAKTIKPKVDTEQMKKVQVEAKKATESVKKVAQVATQKKSNSNSDLWGAANAGVMARQHFPKPSDASPTETVVPKAAAENLHETAQAASKFRQTWTDSMRDVAHSSGEATKAVETYEESMEKYRANIRALRGEQQAAAQNAQTPVGDMSEAERIAKQNAWMFGDPNKFSRHGQTSMPKRASTGTKFSDVWQVANEKGVSANEASQLLKDAQAANQAAQAENNLANASNNATTAKQMLTSAVANLRSGLATAGGKVSAVASGVMNVGRAATSGVSSVASFAKRLVSVPWNAVRRGADLAQMAYAKLPAPIRGAASAVAGFAKEVARVPYNAMRRILNAATFGQLGKGANQAKQGISGLGQSIKGGLVGIMRYVLGFRTLFYLVRAIRKGIAEGFTNLASVDTRTNESLSMLVSRLTQVKNGLATAFAPVLNYVAPILNTLIGYLMDAINAVAQFFATLTGQSTWQKAVYKMQDFSAGASSAGKSADGANKSAKELQKTLLSFDKINKLNDDDSSSGSGGSGGGSGGGGAAGAGMFTTETVNTGISNFANMVKDAWNKADFTQVGAVIGEKLRDALDKIPWDEKIKPMAEKIGKSLGTLITGFVEVPGLANKIGTTIAQAMNTAMTGMNSFLANVHWDSVGKFVMEAIGGVLDKFDYKLAATTGSNLIIAVEKYVTGCIQGVDWENLPGKIKEKVKEALSGVKWNEIFSAGGELAGTITKAIVDLIHGTLKEMGWEDDKTLLENGKNIINGIINGIKNFFAGGLSWVKDNILTPFVEGFQNGFDMHSPSKNPQILELGENIIIGVFNGLKEWVTSNAKTWLDEHVLKKIKNAWDELSPKLEVVVNAVSSGVSSVTDLIGTGKEKVTVTFERVKGWTTSFNDWVSAKADVVMTRVKKWTSSFNDWLDATADLTMTRVKGWSSSFTKWLDASADLLINRVKNWKDSFHVWIGKSADLKINRIKNWKTSFYVWIGKSASLYINRVKNWRTSMKQWITGSSRGVVSIGISLFKSGWSSIKSFFKLGSGGVVGANGGVKLFANGGVVTSRGWNSIPQYAAGSAPTHGSLFVAGEAGAEVVGHLNGRTEVLNRSQMAQIMYSAVVGGMTEALARTNFGGGQVAIIPDPKGIFRVVQTEANNYTNMTGRPAFNL